MFEKDSTKHAHDISNKYVYRISPDNTDVMQEIKGLPIQDIITIHSNALYALEKGFFSGVNMDALNAGEEHAKRFMSAIEHVKSIIIDRLKSANMLWTITDTITGHPFFNDKNQVWIFTDKRYVDECIDHYKQLYRTTFIATEIAKNDIINFIGTTAYMKGAEAFLIDYGQYANIELKAEWIVENLDLSNLPEINRPVMNPVFFRSLAKLKEETFYKGAYDGKEEKLKAFEDDMKKAFIDAKFLIPMKDIHKDGQNKEVEENGTVTMPEGYIVIPKLTKKEGDNISYAFPAFTDWDEFNKVYSQDEWSGWIWRPEDLLEAEGDIIVIDAGSLSFEMSKEMIQHILNK